MSRFCAFSEKRSIFSFCWGYRRIRYMHCGGPDEFILFLSLNFNFTGKYIGCVVLSIRFTNTILWLIHRILLLVIGIKSRLIYMWDLFLASINNLKLHLIDHTSLFHVDREITKCTMGSLCYTVLILYLIQLRRYPLCLKI